MEEKKLEALQAKHREQLQEKRNQINERKARTRRLIIRGAIVEAALPEYVNLSNAEFQNKLYEAISRNEGGLSDNSR